MRFATLSTLFLTAVAANSLDDRQASLCTAQRRINGVKAEIRTISSHLASDAAQIPLALTASRTFIIQPKELGYTNLPPVNVGVTGGSVKALLVLLATFLDAYVPGGETNGAKYMVNNNGSVTVDYVQTDRFALPRVNVREIHEYDLDTCEITSILGYVRGPLIDQTPLVNEDHPQDLATSLLSLLDQLQAIVALLPSKM